MIVFAPQIHFIVAKEKLEIVSGAAPPPFRIFAGGIPRRLRRRNAFGLIQEYCKEFCNFLFLSYTCFLSGHSLSVERVLAKHEGGVQFSLPASVKRSFLICPRKNRMSYRMSYRKWLKIVSFY